MQNKMPHGLVSGKPESPVMNPSASAFTIVEVSTSPLPVLHLEQHQIQELSAQRKL